MYHVFNNRFSVIKNLGKSVRIGRWRGNPCKNEVDLLVFIYQGKCSFKVDDTIYRLLPGDVIYVPANTYYDPESPGNEAVRFYFTSFLPEDKMEMLPAPEISGLLKEYYNSIAEYKPAFSYMLPDVDFNKAVLQTKTSLSHFKNEVHSLLDRSIYERDHLSINSMEVIKYNLCLIISLLTRINISCVLSENAVVKNKDMSLLVQDAIIYIQQNYYKKLSIDTICRQLGVSPQYITRKFTENTGISPLRYINRFRINQAKDLMYNSTLKVKEIAFEVGVEDPNYFCRLFKKTEGITPQEYKEYLNRRIEIVI